MQLIAAFYNPEVQEKKIDYLEKLVNKINTTHKPLNDEDIKNFIEGLKLVAPAAYAMAKSGKQHDPDEFIMALDGTKFLHAIEYTERLLFKRKEEDQQTFFQKQLPTQVSYALRIGFNGEPDNSRQLHDMIVSSREELVNDDEGMTALPWKDYPPYTGAKSSFLEKNESRLTPQEGERLKQYIKQQVFTELPAKLYIQLKRYTDRNKKIEDLVHGTMEITIKPDPNQEDTVQFALEGFILHKGTTTGGHYIAYVKREGKWYEANDSSITECSASDAEQESQQAYLLFYSKKK